MIDEETRWIIEKIFELAFNGAGAGKITRILVDEKVPTAGFALLSLTIQFLDIANEIHTDDVGAVVDTIDGVVRVVYVFIAVTWILNLVMAGFSKCK